MDRIVIKRLEVYAHHGVFEEENRLGQKFYISAELYTDTEQAAKEDDLNCSVNYGEVCKLIVQFLQQHTFRLIETAAVRLTEYLLLCYPLLKKVCLDLEKPSAPVPYPIDTIMVHVERQWHTVYLGIGSNLGDREGQLMAAEALLSKQKDIRIIKKSPLYETAPYGVIDQPPFINGCLEIQTLKQPEELLRCLNSIEAGLGRVREVHWGPRTVDLDILFYDQCVIDTEKLHIPHIDMANRLFVLKPLSDIAGYVRHPYLNKTVEELLKELLCHANER